MSDPFRDHPSSVGESYSEHLGHALSFSFAMFFGSLACLVHAFLPFVFEKTGSGIISRLHDRMVVNRHRLHELKASRRNRAAGK